MRDLRLSTASTQEAPSAEEKSRWTQLCLSYLFGKEDCEKYKLPFQRRVAAFDFGVALDNVLQQTTGVGFSQNIRAITH